MKLYLRLMMVALLWGSTGLLRATIMTPLSVEDLTRRAELVLHGTVESKTCLKDAEGRIYTRIEFKVSEVWKGHLTTNTFQIVHGGGMVGNERTVVDGEATYEAGEELICFLRLNQRGEGVSIGLAQGKFKVQKDKSTGKEFVHNLFHGQPKQDKPTALGSAAAQPARLGLEDLHNLVKGGGQ